VTDPAFIVLDCDGVLFDSNPMKIAAFRTALAAYPDPVVARFSEYQARNFGRSRYFLFERFFDFLGREAAAGEVDALVERYAAIVRAGYLDAPLTPGCLETLQRLGARWPIYVASGSDQAELRWVLERRGLARCLAGIFGSPRSKTDILAELAPGPGRRAVFVGDARADFEAAGAFEWCDFVFMRSFSAAAEDMDAVARQAGFPVIGALPELVRPLGLPNSFPAKSRSDCCLINTTSSRQ
jgi:phosphoglycolate phosphatase-like HAD superfamily hydrolase